MAVAALTSEQKRMLRDYIPALSQKHPPSFNLAQKLGELIVAANTLDLIVSGTGTITSGNVLQAITVGAASDGSPTTVSITNTTSNPVSIISAVWDGAGVLTVTVSGNPGVSGANLAYIVDGR